MPLDPATVLALASVCAPTVAPATLLAVARAESGLNPYAIGINGPSAASVRVDTALQAQARAEALLAAGRDIDLGLGQINVRNLDGLGLSVRAAFDPCRNLAAAGRVLAAAYRRAAPLAGTEQQALRIALSIYNTGNPQRGLANGYVARVSALARTSDPAGRRPARPRPPASGEPSWDVFAAASGAAPRPFVIHPAGVAP